MFTAAVTGSLALTGCGGDGGAGSDGIALGFVNGGDTSFHTCLQKAVEQTAKTQDAKVYSANSHQNAGTELSNIEDMISRNVSALIVQTVNVDSLKGDIAKAKAAGVPIYLTSVSTGDVDDILGAAVVDLGKVGALDAGWVAQDAGAKKVEVGIVAGAPGAASDLLVNGFKKALPANAEVVANQPGMFSPHQGPRTWRRNMIQAHPGPGLRLRRQRGDGLRRPQGVRRRRPQGRQDRHCERHRRGAGGRQER
ncbi:conserved hypothetical protein [Streptomyces sp. e14]|nr:conserved hypothetical protein [Streptomyces sp. e14]